MNYPKIESLLPTLTAHQELLLRERLGIDDLTPKAIFTAAHRLYWDRLWPAKLRIQDAAGKRLLEDTKYTGLALTASVNSLNPSVVLDIGCGQNFYRDKIHNLIGLDLYGTDCDVQVDYFSEGFDKIADVILVLGMLEYGSDDSVAKKLQLLKANCREGTQLFFRFNLSPKFEYEVLPGYDICFFMEKVLYFPEQWNKAVSDAGYQILHSDWDTPNQRWHIRAKAL